MKQLTTTTPVEQDDLLISPYLNRDTLPCVLRDMLTLAPNDNQRDMLLLSSLTSISSVMPNLYFRYGANGKRYYANLQTFIMAAAASGKGIAGLARELVQDIHAKQSLLIPGDSSYASFYRQLYEQGGYGLLFETEGSVITDTWRSQARSYNAALRQAAEHETISRGRINSLEVGEIVNPQLSCLLTGTFDQFHALVPSAQNGFFSRLTTYVDRSEASYIPEVFMSATGEVCLTSDATLETCRRKITAMYATLLKQNKQEHEFRITAEQAHTLGTYFLCHYMPLISNLSNSFHASLVRMGVTTMRILMILSALRAQEAGTLSSDSPLMATDEDFHTALLIAGKLLLHTADAFTQINGDHAESVPHSRSSIQKISFLAQLPNEFSTELCMQLATNTGVTDRTVYRWLHDWNECGTIFQLSHGRYQKSA